ncbi:lactoylglutathione lyase [Streptococcus suis]|uniref:lactoylglutathione lyase n=2 Tax=Streptococcus suis TaxID=1307 RepID=UPI0024126F2B|nr:lactoylglutathione lyase [Streptococcus suis]MDG4508416.1 lactoylglutathione lyase [Streptococcus suis]
MSISSSRLWIAGRFYEAIGFAVAMFGHIKSATLPEGGNLILMQADSFAQRLPFQVVASDNEVLISLNVASRKEVDRLIDRVEVNGG